MQKHKERSEGTMKQDGCTIGQRTAMQQKKLAQNRCLGEPTCRPCLDLRLATIHPSDNDITLWIVWRSWILRIEKTKAQKSAVDWPGAQSKPDTQQHELIFEALTPGLSQTSKVEDG